MAKAPTFEQIRSKYELLYRTMEIKSPVIKAQAQQAAGKLLKDLNRYKAVEKLTGVPAVFLMCTNLRESNGSMLRYLGNGQLLSMKTTIVPKNRGPFASWEDGAVDAIKLEGLDKENNWSVAHIAYDEEAFNGWGYYFHDINSPYLWGGTQHQQSGKYIADGVFDKTIMDTQLGVMVVLKILIEIEPSLYLEADHLPIPDSVTKPVGPFPNTTKTPNIILVPPEVPAVIPHAQKAGWALIGGSILTVIVTQIHTIWLWLQHVFGG